MGTPEKKVVIRKQGSPPFVCCASLLDGPVSKRRRDRCTVRISFLGVGGEVLYIFKVPVSTRGMRRREGKSCVIDTSLGGGILGCAGVGAGV